jgi:hypothetical protein
MPESSQTPLNDEFAAIDRAFKRAVREARMESIRTGTPFYVWQDGKVVDLNAVEPRAAESAGEYKPSQSSSASSD